VAGPDALAVDKAAASPQTSAPLALVGGVTLLWGVNWPAMKFVVGELDPWTFRVICVTLAGFSLLLLARLFGETILLRRAALWPIAALSLANVTGWHMFSAYGLSHIEGGRAAIIAFTMPVWAALLSVWLLKERLTLRRILALVLGLGGILTLVGPDLLRLGEMPVGAVFMLLAAMSWASGTVGIKLYHWGIGVLALAAWQLLIGGIPIILAWPLMAPEGDLSGLSLTGLLALGYVVFVALVFCFSSYIRLVTILPATVAAISILAIPVVGLLSSAVLLGEPAGLREFLALLLVIAALALVLIKPEPRA